MERGCGLHANRKGKERHVASPCSSVHALALGADRGHGQSPDARWLHVCKRRHGQSQVDFDKKTPWPIQEHGLATEATVVVFVFAPCLVPCEFMLLIEHRRISSLSSEHFLFVFAGLGQAAARERRTQNPSPMPQMVIYFLPFNREKPDLTHVVCRGTNLSKHVVTKQVLCHIIYGSN